MYVETVNSFPYSWRSLDSTFCQVKFWDVAFCGTPAEHSFQPTNQGSELFFERQIFWTP